jgi:hypothetical protein
MVSRILEDQALGPIGDIDAYRLFGIGDCVAMGVGQRNGVSGIAGAIGCGQFRCG